MKAFCKDFRTSTWGIFIQQFNGSLQAKQKCQPVTVRMRWIFLCAHGVRNCVQLIAKPLLVKLLKVEGIACLWHIINSQ